MIKTIITVTITAITKDDNKIAFLKAIPSSFVFCFCCDTLSVLSLVSLFKTVSSNTVESHITSLESTISSCVLIDKSNLQDAEMAYTDTQGTLVIYNPINKICC